MKTLEIERTFPDIEHLIAESDWEIFDHKKDIASSDYYNYYYSYAKSWQPESILEIGVRRGYSAISLVMGAKKSLRRFVGIDAEIDIRGSSSFASDLLSSRTDAKISLLNFDTQKDDFSIDGSPFDLIHIDADHSFIGCASDLLLCLSCAKEGTIIVVDDALYSPVRAACEEIKKRYQDSLELQYVTNFRGHCLISVSRSFPELTDRGVRQNILSEIDEIFPKETADSLNRRYSTIRNDLEKGIIAGNESVENLLKDVALHLSRLATPFQSRIRSYPLASPVQNELILALEGFKQPLSSKPEQQNFVASTFSFPGLAKRPSAELKICKKIFNMLASVEHFLIFLKRETLGKCFSYFLGEASKHFSYLYERLYSQTSSRPGIEKLSFDTVECSQALSGRIQTFEGHSLAVVLADALVNIVTSLDRELESQYWMGYWDTKTNKTWTHMVLKEQNFLLSPTPFPVKTEGEYSQFYGLQTMDTAGGVSAKDHKTTEKELYSQLIQNPTDHAFRLATSICHIKMLLSMLQERHPGETLRWLDVGCGIGYIANKVGFDGRFVGIDVADSLIDYANRTRFSDSYTYLTGGFDEARSAVGGKKFHLITATEVVEHIFDPLDFVAQMKEHTCDLIYASSPLNEAVPHQPSREHLWSFSLESYEQLFRLSDMKVTFSGSMYAGKFIGEGHNWLSVVATTDGVLRVFPKI